MITFRQKYSCIALGSALLLFSNLSSAAPTSCSFSATNTVDCQMANGARWEFSWVNDAQRGMVLNQVTLTAKAGAPRTLILEQAALAQVMESYDSGSTANHYLSDVGLPMLPITADECPAPGNLLRDNGAGNPLICQMTAPRGYAWRGTGQIQGESLVFFSVSKGGKNTYIHKWVFNDDGTINPMLGVSGELDPLTDSTSNTTGWPISSPTRYATNRFQTAYWRLDFALGGQTNDLFQQMSYATGGYTVNQTITDVTSESSFTISPEAQKFWVVKDKTLSNSSNGQKIAFEIVPQHTSIYRGADAFSNYDIYVSQNKSCEKFVSHNPTATGCGASVSDFVNGETITDPVVWMGSTWHQVPRAEDEANVQTHWQGFILAPRDLTATSPYN